jgi:hypothetical protein
MVALRLDEAPMLGKGEVIAITLEVLRLEIPMFMEIQTDLRQKQPPFCSAPEIGSVPIFNQE